VSDPKSPTPFEVHESGAYLHGTKADLAIGDLLVPGRASNFGIDRAANQVYVTMTLDAATWGAELAPEQVKAMQDRVAEVLRNGDAAIDD
jgi:rifampin ADP-ribosylating transferase